jgi:predicted Zn-dependent protease
MEFPREWVEERLEWALGHCGQGTDGMEAMFYGCEANNMRLAESTIVQASDITHGKVSLRALVGNRQARASTTDLSNRGLQECASRAVASAKQTPVSKETISLPHPSLAGPESPPAVFEGVLGLDSATKQEWLREGLTAHRSDDLALAGRFHTGVSTWAVRSSAGMGTYHRGTWVDLALSALERPAGHRASSCRVFFDGGIEREQLSSLAEEVRSECHRAHDPKDLAPGEWDVVLAPMAVAELLEWMGMIAFNSEPFDDGTSCIHGRVGKKITGDAISIFDDASIPHGVGVPVPFDIEGVAKKKVELITAGVAKGIVHDSRTAGRHGCQSTGHAQVSDDFPSAGSQASHLHIAAGEGDVDTMVQSIKRGIFVTRFHYVNGMIEPRRAVMTGLLRDAAFLIEDGRLKHAVSPMRFTDSILEAFDRIPGKAGVSRQTQAHGSFFGPLQCTVVPSLLIPKLKFTSGR